MSVEEPPLETEFLAQLIRDSKGICSENLKQIEEKLNHLDKLEIIARLSILTQTDTGRECLQGYLINDTPCLQFVIGLALRDEVYVSVEPSEQDIDEILQSISAYFKSFFLSLRSSSKDKGRDDEVVFQAKLHELIGQVNPEKYPFQIIELLAETFGQFDNYFSTNFGFTVNDAIEFSKKIVKRYVDSINSRKDRTREKEIPDNEKYSEFFSRSKDLMEIVPDDFCQDFSFDITKFSSYLKRFSCRFGEGDSTYNSPLGDNIFSKRPILFHDGRYFVPIPQDLFQKLPLIFESLLENERRKNSKIWTKYQEKKSKYTERKVTECIRRLFDKDDVYENLFYTIGDGKAEVDHIINYCDNVIIIESKSGNFSISSMKDGILRIATNLKRLICEAHNQGLRVKGFIKAEKTARFEDKRGKTVLEITYDGNKTNFILINVTLESLLSFSSGLKKLEPLGIFSQSDFPWSVNLFELDIITQHLDSPAIFIHYIESRLKAQDEDLFATFDELSFFSFYLDYGIFKIYFKDGSTPDWIQLDTDFLEPFDRYYLYGGKPPKLNIEMEIKRIISELEQKRPECFTKLTNTLLDFDHGFRAKIIQAIKKIRFDTQLDGNKHDFTMTTENNRIGITCISQIGRGDLSDVLAGFCTFKKYKLRADRWIGLGIDVLDSKYLINEYFFDDTEWKKNKDLDKMLERADEMGFGNKDPVKF